MRAGLRMFAVRMGDYVEIRVGAEAPKAKISKFTKTVKVKKTDYVWSAAAPNYVYKTRTVPETLTLKQTFYIGGKVVVILKGTKYNGWVALYNLPKLTKEGVVEITGDMVRKIGSSAWRRRNGL